MPTGKRNERGDGGEGREGIVRDEGPKARLYVRVNSDLVDRIVSRIVSHPGRSLISGIVPLAYRSRYSYLALSGDAKPSFATVAFRRNPVAAASAKIRGITGRAIHYCRFKRCVKTLADCTAIERAGVRRWRTTVIAIRLGGS